MQMQNVHMMHTSHFQDAISMMQMSHAGVQMQSLSMMVPAHIFNRDVNVSLVHAMMRMSAWEYAYDANVRLGVCLWCECPLVGVS